MQCLLIELVCGLAFFQKDFYQLPVQCSILSIWVINVIHQGTCSCNFKYNKTILEKVLLDPIFIELKCELFTHFGSCF